MVDWLRTRETHGTTAPSYNWPPTRRENRLDSTVASIQNLRRERITCQRTNERTNYPWIGRSLSNAVQRLLYYLNASAHCCVYCFGLWYSYAHDDAGATKAYKHRPAARAFVEATTTRLSNGMRAAYNITLNVRAARRRVYCRENTKYVARKHSEHAKYVNGCVCVMVFLPRFICGTCPLGCHHVLREANNIARPAYYSAVGVYTKVVCIQGISRLRFVQPLSVVVLCSASVPNKHQTQPDSSTTTKPKTKAEDETARSAATFKQEQVMLTTNDGRRRRARCSLFLKPSWLLGCDCTRKSIYICRNQQNPRTRTKCPNGILCEEFESGDIGRVKQGITLLLNMFLGPEKMIF